MWQSHHQSEIASSVNMREYSQLLTINTLDLNWGNELGAKTDKHLERKQGNAITKSVTIV
jgi:hypothetical protein